MRPRWPRRRRVREPRYQVVEVIGSSEQLNEAVGLAAERIAEQRAAPAARGGGGLRTLVLLAAAMAAPRPRMAAMAAAWRRIRWCCWQRPWRLRALLRRDFEADPLPGPLEGATGDLRSAREALEAGIAEGRRASAEAERALREDLRARREGGR